MKRNFVASLTNIVTKKSQKIYARRLLLAAVLLVFLTGIGGYIIYRNNTIVYRPSPCQAGDADGVLQRGANAIASNDIKQLETVVDEIKSLPEYENDVDCLNIVTTYHIQTNDLEKAQANLNKLETLYNDKEGFSAVYGTNLRSLEGLQSDVAALKKQHESVPEGSVFYGPVVEQNND